MLFKKYFGRFGGIIEDTHDEFVENISNLIEKDLINHHTLNDEFNSQKFHNYIKELTKDMFLYSIPNNSINLKDIQGISQTTDNFIDFLDTHKNTQKDLINNITSKNLNQLVSKQQIYNLAKDVANILNKNKSIYLDDFIVPVKKLKINSFITEELIFHFTQNINEIINKIDISSFDKEIDETIHKLLEDIDIDDFLNIIKAEVENIYLKDIFTEANNGIKNLLDKFIEIAISPEGEEVITKSIYSILDSLKNIDISILSLFDDTMKKSIKLFVKNELPTIIAKIIEFMDQNEKDLEELINGSIDKALDDGMFSDIKKKIVSIFYTNIVADFKILNMIKSYMNEYRTLAEEEISSQVINILENRSIGELYDKIAKKNIITPQKVISLIIKNLKNFDTGKNIPVIENMLQKQISNYIDVDLSFVKQQLIPLSITKLKKDYIYNQKMKDMIFNETKNIIDEFKIKTLNEILGNKIDKNFQKISSLINENKILNTIIENIDNISDKPINHMLNFDNLDLNYKNYIDEFIATKSIKEIIIYIQNEEIYDAISNALIKVVIDNLEDILEGNVSEAVKKELAKLSPAKIKEMVEEFMGEELKPINYFGALLGGLAGGGVGVLSVPVWANPFIYGVVGIATNYLAIKMLFQPYLPLKIGKVKIPLTQGVLPSNKEKMSIKMSEFVDEFMLNGTSINEFFKHNSDSLKEFIKVHISKDEYSIIDKIIHQNTNIKDLSNKIFELLFQFLDTNQDMISNKITNIVVDYYDNRKKYTKEINETIFQKFISLDFKEFLYQEFDKFIDKESSIEFAKDELFELLDKFIENSFYSLLDILSDQKKLKEKLIYFENDFVEFTKSKSVSDILDKKTQQNITSKINNSFTTLFYGEEVFNELLNFFTKGEFGSSSKLSDMINGMLPNIIENNLYLILNNIVLPALKNKKTLIRNEILQKVPFGMGWAVKRDVNRTINIILDKEIPSFIEEKIKQINIIVQDVLETQLIELGYTKDIVNKQKVDELIKSILNNQNFEKSFEQTMIFFMNKIFSMDIASILKILNIKNISDIYDHFEYSINNVITHLTKNISNSEENILKNIKNLIKEDIAYELLISTSIGDLLKNIDKNILLKEFEYLINTIKESKEFEKAIKGIIKNFISIFLKKDFLDKKILKDDLEEFLKIIIQDKEAFREILTPFFKEFILNINKILDLNLKDNIIDIIIKSAFESINTKIVDLIQAVDFKKVITKEIQNMHPKELEDMFYSFAGKYFNKLILYGSLGFFFGLATIF